MDTNGVTSRTQPSASLDVESGVQNSAVSQGGCLGTVGRTLAAALVLGAGGITCVACVVGGVLKNDPKHVTAAPVLLSILGGLLMAASGVTLCTAVPTPPDVNNNRSAPSRSGGDTFVPTGAGCGGGGGGGCGGGGGF